VLTVDKALQLRSEIQRAVLWKRPDRLATLARVVVKSVPTKQALITTGIGRLVADQVVWSLTPQSTQELVKVACKKWRDMTVLPAEPTPVTVAPTPTRAFNGVKPGVFLEQVQQLQDYVAHADYQPTDQVTARAVAINFALQGITSWEHLDGVDVVDLVAIFDLPAERAAAVRAVELASRRAMATRVT
jgi:hypothetical protein